MTDYEALFSWVLPDVSGCPEIAAVQAIRDATIQFCEQSLIHQADHDPVSVVAKIPDYDLESPATATRITKVMKVWYKGSELTPAAPDQIRDPAVYNQRIGGYETSYSQPRFFIQKDSATISLLPIPDQTLASAVTMRVALVPLRTSTQCADFLFEQWPEEIAAGAIARLQDSANRAYSNPKLAALANARFMVGINSARQKAVRGYNRSSLSVQLRKV